MNFKTEEIKELKSGLKLDHKVLINYRFPVGSSFEGFSLSNGDALFMVGYAQFKSIRRKVRIGDILPIKETWQKECEEIQIAGGNWSNSYLNATGNFVYKADDYILPKNSVAFGSWKSPVHIPDYAVRFWLKITEIDVKKENNNWYWVYKFNLITK